jgi:hypothetical protein
MAFLEIVLILIYECEFGSFYAVFLTFVAIKMAPTFSIKVLFIAFRVQSYVLCIYTACPLPSLFNCFGIPLIVLLWKFTVWILVILMACIKAVLTELYVNVFPVMSEVLLCLLSLKYFPSK